MTMLKRKTTYHRNTGYSLALAFATALQSTAAQVQATATTSGYGEWTNFAGGDVTFCRQSSAGNGNAPTGFNAACASPGTTPTPFQATLATSASAGGPVRGSASLTGSFLAQRNANESYVAVVQSGYMDVLSYNPSVPLPAGGSLIFMLALDGANPSTLVAQSSIPGRCPCPDAFSSSAGDLYLTLIGVPGGNAGHLAIASQSPEELTQRIVIPLSSLFSPQQPFTELFLSLQAAARIDATGVMTTRTFEASTASLFFNTGYISRIEAVDAAGNDITQQIGLTSASGSLGWTPTAAPEPGSLALLGIGLIGVAVFRPSRGVHHETSGQSS